MSEKLDRSDMTKSMQSEARKAVKAVARKARAGWSSSAMKPEDFIHVEQARHVFMPVFNMFYMHYHPIAG